MATTPTDSNPVTEYTQIISLAVHEMRTPASVVGGYLRMLLSDTGTPLDPRHRRMLEEAEKSCGRLVGLLSELSDLAKLDAGTAAVRHERFDIFELVRELASNVHEGDDREVRLEPQGLAVGALVEGDRMRIRSSLECVMRAVMREQPSSTVVVLDTQRVHDDGGRPVARIVVAPAADVARAAATRAGTFEDQRGGLGLGLPLARRVVTRHGGQIWSPVPTDGSELPLGARGAIVVTFPLLE
ncbi:MAG: sensor histidine kinase [Vicinamibacterales bacterium]